MTFDHCEGVPLIGGGFVVHFIHHFVDQVKSQPAGFHILQGYVYIRFRDSFWIEWLGIVIDHHLQSFFHRLTGNVDPFRALLAIAMLDNVGGGFVDSQLDGIDFRFTQSGFISTVADVIANLFQIF